MIEKSYKQVLIDSMKLLAEKDESIFIGQQIIWRGNPMSTTLEYVPKEKMIELPVMEESQMGISLGMAMAGKFVVTFYPRWDFLICASNQLINHLDKLESMSDGEFIPNVIIRVGKGSDKPLDPGHQHKADYSDEFSSMLKHIPIIKLDTADKILPAYKKALSSTGPIILVEYPELYYEN